MDNSNIILQMPFDESAGATKTYDYSQSRADGTVNGATFVAGKNGNAISFGGSDTCEVQSSSITIDSYLPTALREAVMEQYNKREQQDVNYPIEIDFMTTDPAQSVWPYASYLYFGSVWYNPDDDTLKIYSALESSRGWVAFENDDVLAQYRALYAAAQYGENNCRRIFLDNTVPYTPYDVGDLWEYGDTVMICKTSKAKGYVNSPNDWEEYTYSEQTIFNLLNGDFTIAVWAQGKTIECGSPQQMIWVLNFDGDDAYIEFAFDAKPDTWYYLALVREGNNYSFYVNNVLKKTIARGGTLVGIALNQDCYSVAYGLGLLDDLTIYNDALTLSEIQSIGEGAKKITYTIDGIDFKTWGVYVSSSKGVVDRPAIKTPASIDWDDYHGESVDLNHIYYKSREITLGCFVKADSKESFIEQVRKFEQQFDGSGLHRLEIDVHPTKPLIYLVYVKDSIEITKTWSNDLMVGTFNLTLIEPEPVKRVLKHYRTGSGDMSCNIRMTSTRYLNIYWDDGNVDYDVCGVLNKTINTTHTYDANGEYYIVITGNIDEIEDFDTNAIVVWEKI